MAGFLAKAYQIFDNPSWSDVCGWGQNGETVVIRKQIEFAQRILPLYFNHSNLQSFVRQVRDESRLFCNENLAVRETTVFMSFYGPFKQVLEDSFL